MTVLYCVTEFDSKETGPCKIGITAIGLKKRLGQLQTGNYRTLEVAWAIEPNEPRFAQTLEFNTLTKFRPSIYAPDDRPRLKSEWIDTAPDKAFEWVRRMLDIAGIEFLEVAA